MTLKEFKELDKNSEKYQEMINDLSLLQRYISIRMEVLFDQYKENTLESGEYFGKGPTDQVLNDVIKEFIKKYD